MTNTAEIFELIRPQGDANHLPSAEATRSQLNRILHSKTFQRAKRLRSLLEYVVTSATSGKTNGQPEAARELFGKGDDFDPSIDPVIRVQFGRLRRALANYYLNEGKKDSIVIDIPSRRYTPVFRESSAVPTNANMMDTAPNGRMTLQPTAGPVAAPADSGGGAGGGPRPVIAVLPFANLTSDAAQDAFCYGLTEEIANSLASIAGVDIVASSSAFQFKDEHVDVREAGRELA